MVVGRSNAGLPRTSTVWANTSNARAIDGAVGDQAPGLAKLSNQSELDWAAKPIPANQAFCISKAVYSIKHPSGAAAHLMHCHIAHAA